MLFLGANNVPVPNVRVRFDFDGNPAPNGSLSSGDALVYSDSRGIAVTNYRAGTAASPTDGVVVRACWSNTDFAVGTCTNSKTVKLTVVEEGLAVTIGTNDVIQEGATGITYIKRYVVQVANASGAPVGSQQVTPQIDLPFYYKGNYRWNGSTWIAGRGDFLAGNLTRQLSILSCENEDRNRNGAIELPEGDDLNGNGTLEPRKSDVTVSMEGGTDKTNASGQVVLLIEYPKSHAGWVGVDISASADVRSPPARWIGILPVDAGALKRETPPPAFATSPYKAGASSSCAIDD
jgi:predicted RecA/RadA family phage recombinase